MLFCPDVNLCLFLHSLSKKTLWFAQCMNLFIRLPCLNSISKVKLGLFASFVFGFKLVGAGRGCLNRHGSVYIFHSFKHILWNKIIPSAVSTFFMVTMVTCPALSNIFYITHYIHIFISRSTVWENQALLMLSYYDAHWCRALWI